MRILVYATNNVPIFVLIRKAKSKALLFRDRQVFGAGIVVTDPTVLSGAYLPSCGT